MQFCFIIITYDEVAFQGIFYLIICLSTSFILSIFIGSSTGAISLNPTCVNGSVIWNNIDSTFNIDINCQNTISFSNTSSPLTLISEENLNIYKIKLTAFDSFGNLKTTSPYIAEITEYTLRLTFRASGYDFNNSLANLGLEIGANLLFNEFGDANDIISINFENFSDQTILYATDDYYTINDDYLNVIAKDGVLKNDIDAIGGIYIVSIVDMPRFGNITINDDGSFTYYPIEAYFGNDSFTYSITDNSGNTSPKVYVYITDADAEIYNISFINLAQSGDEGYAKSGDILRLTFYTNEPVDIDSIYIGGNEILDYASENNNSFTRIIH